MSFIEELSKMWLFIKLYWVLPSADHSTLMVSQCVTCFHCLSHGLMVAFSFLTVLQILSGFFFKLSFLRKQIQAAHSNAAEERNSSMINTSKTNSHNFQSLSWTLLFIVLEKTHIDNPFQLKTPSDLMKKMKKSIAEYNSEYSSK